MRNSEKNLDVSRAHQNQHSAEFVYPSRPETAVWQQIYSLAASTNKRLSRIRTRDFATRTATLLTPYCSAISAVGTCSTTLSQNICQVFSAVDSGQAASLLLPTREARFPLLPADWGPWGRVSTSITNPNGAVLIWRRAENNRPLDDLRWSSTSLENSLFQIFAYESRQSPQKWILNILVTHHLAMISALAESESSVGVGANKSGQSPSSDSSLDT